MSWEQATNADIMGRLLAQDGPAKGGQVGTPNPAYAPNAPVRPAAQVTGTPLSGPKPQDMPMPMITEGTTNLNPAQYNYAMSANTPSESPQPLPFAAYNWNQSRPSATTGAPAWADQVLNQSAYNTVPKGTPDRPTYARGWDGFNRAGENITFRTQDVGNQWSRNAGYRIPQQNRGQDWFGLVDTSRNNWWRDPSAIRYEYRPPEPDTFGRDLLGGLSLIGGAMLGSPFGLGDFGTAMSNVGSVIGNSR